MSIQKQIEAVRQFKTNPGAYARVMSAAIRSAMSDRAVQAYRTAVEQDGMTAYFANWSGSCPVAA